MRYRPHRYPTEFPVAVKVGDHPFKATIIDVNETGARLECDTPPARGTKLTIQFKNQTAKAIVMWATETRIGLVFRPQLSLRDIDLIRYGQRSRGHIGRFNSTHLMELR